MENKSHALMAGLFTIALATAAIMAGMWFSRDRVQWVPYDIATRLSIPGLSSQAAVRYRGLDVGKVDKIEFDPNLPGQILVHISVQPDTPITHSTFATLGYQGVTGIAYVQLDDDGSVLTRMPSDKQHVARIDMRPGLLDQLQNRGLVILKQTEEIAQRITNLLEPMNQQAVLDNVNKIGRAASAFEAIPRQLQPTMAKLPEMTAQTQRTLMSLDVLSKQAGGLVNNLNTMADNLQSRDGALARMTSSVEQIGGAADRLGNETVPLASEMRAALRALNHTLESLNERPQSVLFGAASIAPGPGEPGFTPPSK